MPECDLIRIEPPQDGTTTGHVFLEVRILFNGQADMRTFEALLNCDPDRIDCQREQPESDVTDDFYLYEEARQATAALPFLQSTGKTGLNVLIAG